jgi:hypothetical protein
MKKLNYIFLCFIMFFTLSSYAANHYILDGGTGDGTAWDNALDDLPSSLIRGDTYYIGDGIYAAYTFNDEENSSDVITIKKSTVSDHGDETGYLSTDHDGQAVFGTWTFVTGYYIIDGQYGGEPNDWDGTYGIYLYEKNCVEANSDAPSHVSFSHVDFEGHGPDGDGTDNDIIYLIGKADDSSQSWSFSYCSFHDSGRTLILPSKIHSVTIEYCFFARNESVASEHSEAIAVQKGDHYTIKYSKFEDITGTGVIVLKKNYDTWTNDDFKIYGNIFIDLNDTGGTGNGAIADTSGGVAASNNILVYNNTFIGLEDNSGINWVLGTGNYAYNNLWYDCEKLTFTNSIHDYNSFINSDTRSTIGDNEEETTGSPSPFMGSTDFHLNSPTNSGKNDLGSPYNMDMDNITRGADDIWDRGAYEYIQAGASTQTGRNGVNVNGTRNAVTIPGRMGVITH